jgi:phage repressor protein C with HTH and peptisase S24 domain
MVGNDRGFAERLAGAVKAAGGPKVVSAKSGIPQNTITNWTSKIADPTIKKLALVAEACGVSIDWLVGFSEGGSTISGGWHPESVDGFSLVPRYDVRASAGPGAVVASGDLDGSGFVAFRTEWLHRIGVHPGRAEVILAVGDSMDPTIRDGDLILVDRSIDRIVDNGIYVVTVGGLVLVKRVQSRIDGGVVLISDNPQYERETVPDHQVPDLRIEGRVRWFGRTI